MFILNAQHPTVCGSVVKLFHTRAAAEREGVELLHIIGDDLVKSHEDCEGESHPKSLVWLGYKDRGDIPFVALERFVVGLDSEDEEDQEWCVEIIEKKVEDADEVNEIIGDELAGGGLSLSAYSGNDRFTEYLDVQPLDPADMVVTTLLHALAELEAVREAGEEVPALENARKAIAEGQAWLDKARPVGKIAEDVVRLAGIIVAGTDLHASLSEAMDQHIYDENDEREPDCHYQAVLDAWTDALAGITVTTPAPPAAPVYDVPE